MQEFHLVAGVEKILHVFVEDTKRSDGGGKTGLVYDSTDLECHFVRPGDEGSTQLVLVDTELGIWVSGGFKQVDATNMAGWYELQLAAACVAPSFEHCMLHLYDGGSSGMAVTSIRLLEDQRRLYCRHPRGQS
jgi:hypothetical protein